MSDPNWIDNFITYDNNREQFIAWDETQAGEIGNGFDSWEQAEIVILEYGKDLNEKYTNELNDISKRLKKNIQRDFNNESSYTKTS